MNRVSRIKAAIAVAVLLLGNGLFAAEEPLSVVKPLPALLEKQEMRIVEVRLTPGQNSMPHRHNAHVYGYVLEGEIEFQVRGGALMRLKPGDSFYESPDDIHEVSRNPSDSVPARFLVHMLKPAGEPATVPVN